MQPPCFCSRRQLALPLLAMTAGWYGCGVAAPELAEVTGTITLNGQPLQGAAVRFTPVSGAGWPAHGTTNAEGRYRLLSADGRPGAMPGQHMVAISVEELLAAEQAEQILRGRDFPLPAPQIPARYSSGEFLRADVQPGRNVRDFALGGD